MNTLNNPSLLRFNGAGTIVTGCVFYASHVTIPDNVVFIENQAFCGHDSLVSIEIPNSVTTIGDSAFYGCTSLTSIEIPNTVTTIGDSAFRDCKSLTNIEIPNSVTTIQDWSFCGCKSLTNIEIPISVTIISRWAFSGCSSLTSIEIPDSVTFIGKNAFSGCTSLKSIKIPNSVMSIGCCAFQDCTSLTSIEIPNSVTNIEVDAFSGLISLCSIIIKDDNPNYTSKNGILFSKNKDTIIAYPGGKSGDSFIIPKETESIAYRAFYKCKHLKSVTFYDNLKKIGSYAFSDSHNLHEIHLRNEHPEAIVIDDNAFYGLNQCTLYVPIGTGYAYRHDERFKGMFSEVKIER